MKKFHVLLIAVLLTATLSAFTGKESGTLFYQDSSGLFHEIEGDGDCVPVPDIACAYEYTGEGKDPNDPNDPENYQAVGEDDREFIPDPDPSR